MEEEEVGQIVPEDAGTGVNFNAMMRRMARESIAGAGPSTNIDVETLRATAATLAQKAMAILSDESAKGRPIGGINDIAAAMGRRLYQSMAREETQAEPPSKLTQERPIEAIPQLATEILPQREAPPALTQSQERKFKLAMLNADVPPVVANTMLQYGITGKQEAAAFLANAKAESNIGRDRLERTDDARGGRYYDPATGLDWRGRGVLQITHRQNYEHIAKILDMPEIMENPDLLLDPAIGAAAAAAFWRYGGPQADGGFASQRKTPSGEMYRSDLGEESRFAESMYRITGRGAETTPDKYLNKRYPLYKNFMSLFNEDEYDWTK